MLRNLPAAASAVSPGSLGLFIGPIAVTDRHTALQHLEELSRQFTQHAEMIATLGGPAVNPDGAEPLSPNGLVTVNTTTPTNALHTGSASTSPYATISARGVAGPRIWIGQNLSPPITITRNRSVPAWSGNGASQAAFPYSPDHPAFARIEEIKVELSMGPEQTRFHTTVGEYLRNHALPTLRAYQEVAGVLWERIRATRFSDDPGMQKRAWRLLRTCDPAITNGFVDTLRVLRAPNGVPIFLPPLVDSRVREAMIEAISQFALVFPPPKEF